MSDPLIGKQLGDYLIRDLLGRGGMARVYTGYDARLDRLAAVKVINNDFSPADRAEYYERFQREARAIARLNHPNIVGIYQFGQYEDAYYMAMVFVEGRDLRQILREYNDRREIMPIPDVLNVVRGIGSALDYAHSRGVIHRDVKPSNILLNRENRSILTDFGLALNASEGTLGETFGSAHYIAPEQAVSSAKAVPQSDLYSLGVCIYEMLTGKVPFDDPSAMSVALKHLQDPPPPLRDHNPSLSPAIERVVLHALDKDPERRYRSGVELTQALHSAIENAALPDTSKVSAIEIRAAAAALAQEKPPTIAYEPPPSVPPQPPAEQISTSIPADAPTPPPPPPAAPPVPPVAAAPRIDPPSAPAAPIPANAQTSLSMSTVDLTKMNARRVPLLPLLALFIMLVAGGLLFAVQAGLISGKGVSTPTPTRTVTARPPSATVDNRATQLAALASAPVTSQATSQVALVSSAAPTASETITLTDTPSNSSTPTEAPTLTVTPSIPPTDTPLPSDTPTPSDTFAPTPTTTSGSSASSTPALVSTQSATASATASSIERTDVLLIYDGFQLVLVNKTAHPITVKNLIFVQHAKTERRFDASQWLLGAASDTLQPQYCYQAVRLDLQQRPPPFSECGIMAAFRQVGILRQFWILVDSSVPTFEVLLDGHGVATCTISAGRCAFALPEGI